MPNRPRAWADLIFQQQITSGAFMATQDLLADLAARPLDTVTVTRIVGTLHLFIEMPDPQVEGIMKLDVGIGVVAASAFPGVAVPDPGISTEYPPRGWLYADTKWVAQSAGASTMQQSQQPVWSVDLGAMRKIDKGILFCAAKSTLVDGAAFTVRFGGRLRSLCLT